MCIRDSSCPAQHGAAGYRDACAGGLIEPLSPPAGCTPQYRAEWLNEQRRHLADATERNNS